MHVLVTGHPQVKDLAAGAMTPQIEGNLNFIT
jgi:hypothetical protein